MMMLKRLIRYLKGTIDGCTISSPEDWAGKENKRSTTSGGVLFLAGPCVLIWSQTQAARALSSCEAELYTLGSGASECLWLVSVVTEEQVLRGAPRISRTAAVPHSSAFSRPGRVKHVEALLLAQQDWRQQGRINVVKCATVDNLSDPFTKYVTEAIIAVSFLFLGRGREGVRVRALHTQGRCSLAHRTALRVYTPECPLSMFFCCSLSSLVPVFGQPPGYHLSAVC